MHAPWLTRHAGARPAAGRLLCCALALALFAAVCPAQPLSLAISGQPVDSLPALTVALAGSLQVDLQIANEGGSTVTLTSAQAAFLLRPLAGATGEIGLDLITSPSLFGPPAGVVPSMTDGGLTAQAGAALPASVGPGSRSLFARLDLSPLGEASGDFELIALEFDPLNLLKSSHWLPPGGLGPPFPAPTPFGNATAGGEIRIATVSVSVGVPEPNGLALLAGAYLGSAWRRLGVGLASAGGCGDNAVSGR